MRGHADNLGGGVWKKRLGHSRERSIILAKSGALWVYEFLFSKQDRASITDAELMGFRKLAAVYATLGESTITALLSDGHWAEMCDAPEAEV